MSVSGSAASIGSGISWKNIFLNVSKYLGAVTLLGLAIGGVTRGYEGSLAFLAGSLLIYLCFSIGIVVVSITERRSMANAARALVATYVVKVFVLGIALLGFSWPSAIKNGWMLAGAICAVTVWLVVEMITIMKMRILYFDDDDGSAAKHLGD